MADEVPGKILKVGDVSWIIVDEGETPLRCPDFLIDTRQFNGEVHLALATTRVEGGICEAVVCTRVRMSLVFAQVLRDTLDRMVKDAMNPSQQEKPN